VAGAAPVVAGGGRGIEPEEVHAIDALGNRGAGVGRGASSVAAGVEVEIGRGNGDVPAVGTQGVGELEVSRAAAIGGRNGEVIDPEQPAQRRRARRSEPRTVYRFGTNDGH